MKWFYIKQRDQWLNVERISLIRPIRPSEKNLFPDSTYGIIYCDKEVTLTEEQYRKLEQTVSWYCVNPEEVP